MLKTIALLKCKAGMSHSDFIAYYENHHVPLIREITPGILEYRRNYIDRSSIFPAEFQKLLEFDVVTEVCYANRADYELAMQASIDPVNAARIAADEENFLDRQRTRYFVTDTHESR